MRLKCSKHASGYLSDPRLILQCLVGSAHYSGDALPRMRLLLSGLDSTVLTQQVLADTVMNDSENSNRTRSLPREPLQDDTGFCAQWVLSVPTPCWKNKRPFELGCLIPSDF